MTQQSVYNLLKRKKKWMTNKQIAAILKISPGSVALCTRKLFNQGELLRKTSAPRKSLFSGVGYNPYLWMIK
ncbi:hypothetical protein LCGC14_2478300 [marine sediment metagenome]|uniref:Uncharacterized protein n=1 Tax=marine sediment metagenome TaxID=412755 RepID=A0A0F9B925_9ZZZZ